MRRRLCLESVSGCGMGRKENELKGIEVRLAKEGKRTYNLSVPDIASRHRRWGTRYDLWPMLGGVHLSTPTECWYTRA